eukprot:184760_1
MGAAESSKCCIYMSDEDFIEEKSTPQFMLSQRQNRDVYIRKCDLKDMIKILNSYGIERLLQYYHKSTHSEHRSIIHQYRNNIVKYFTNNEIDGNVFCDQDKNKFVTNVIKYITSIDHDIHVNNTHIDTIKEVLSTLYRIMINYESYLDISSNSSENDEENVFIELKDNSENKQNQHDETEGNNINQLEFSYALQMKNNMSSNDTHENNNEEKGDDTLYQEYTLNNEMKAHIENNQNAVNNISGATKNVSTSVQFSNIQNIIININKHAQQKIDIDDVIGCFINNNMNEKYFDIASKERKVEFIGILRKECGANDTYATVLWDNLTLKHKVNHKDIISVISNDRIENQQIVDKSHQCHHVINNISDEEICNLCGSPYNNINDNFDDYYQEHEEDMWSDVEEQGEYISLEEHHKIDNVKTKSSKTWICQSCEYENNLMDMMINAFKCIKCKTENNPTFSINTESENMHKNVSDATKNSTDVLPSNYAMERSVINNNPSRIELIDNAISIYYHNLGINDYRDINGKGKFYLFIEREAFDDDELSIEKELGKYSNAENTMYVEFDPYFPLDGTVEKMITVNNVNKLDVIFYVLQHCYQYNHPPTTDKIIAEISSIILNLSKNQNNKLKQDKSGADDNETFQQETKENDTHLYQYQVEQMNLVLKNQLHYEKSLTKNKPRNKHGNHMPSNNLKSSRIQQIDKAIGKYYDSVGNTDYFNPNGIGKFAMFIEQEAFDDDEVSIQKELGNHSSAENTMYIHFDPNFPFHDKVLKMIVNNNIDKNDVIFYVMQFCYKCNSPPSADKIIIEFRAPPAVNQQKKKSIIKTTPSTDLSMFSINNNMMECTHDTKCPMMLRLITALQYYNLLDMSNQQHQNIFSHLINEYSNVLNDYIHLTTKHSHDDFRMYGVKCNAQTCQFGIRSVNERNAKTDVDPKVMFYQELLDSLHYRVYHPFDFSFISERKFSRINNNKFTINLMTNDAIDLSLFNTNSNKCNKMDDNNIIDNCQCLQRLSYALKYYHKSEKLGNSWIHFCLNIYSHQMLEDYSHLLSVHGKQVE